MSTTFDVSGYTLNPIEAQSLSEFIVENVLQQPTLNQIHKIWTGVKMKQQIPFINQMGLSGIADSGCSRPESGANFSGSEKYFEPAKIGDTFINCQSDMDALFKAYFNKINAYAEKYDITGSDLDKLIAAMISNSLSQSIYRFAWLGDTDVDVAGALVAGLKSAGNAKFFDVIDGLWKQIFAGVTANKITKIAISENTETTLDEQLTLASSTAIDTLNAMYKKASQSLKGNANAKFLLSGELFENYYQYLLSKGSVYNIDYITNGLPTLKYRNFDVVNMATIWDIDLQAYFVDNTTNNAGYLPNRAVFTTPENIPIGTLNENDLSSLESWYNRDERKNKTSYGYTLDAKLIKESEIVVAY